MTCGVVRTCAVGWSHARRGTEKGKQARAGREAAGTAHKETDKRGEGQQRRRREQRAASKAEAGEGRRQEKGSRARRTAEGREQREERGRRQGEEGRGGERWSSEGQRQVTIKAVARAPLTWHATSTRIYARVSVRCGAGRRERHARASLLAGDLGCRIGLAAHGDGRRVPRRGVHHLVRGGAGRRCSQPRVAPARARLGELGAGEEVEEEDEVEEVDAARRAEEAGQHTR